MQNRAASLWFAGNMSVNGSEQGDDWMERRMGTLADGWIEWNKETGVESKRLGVWINTRLQSLSNYCVSVRGSSRSSLWHSCFLLGCSGTH